MPRRTTTPKPPPMLHGGDLRSRGWTKSLMGRFLPAPERTRGTRYGSTVPLWGPATIEAIEATAEFRAEFERAARRKVSARKAAETRLAAMDRRVDELAIELPEDLDQVELTRLAIRSFNHRGLDRLCAGRGDRFREATDGSDPRFLERITVNFARHCGTSYEELLGRTFGRTGGDRARDRIRARVLDAIGARWPGLRDECDRQKVQG